MANNIRREPTYLSREVWRSLWLLSKAWSDNMRNITPDELADTLLRDMISEKYPQLFELEKEIEKKRQALIESLKK